MAKLKGKFKIDKEKYYYSKLGNEKPFFLRKIKVWMFNYGLHATAVYRFGQFASKLYSKSKLLGLIPKIIHFYLNQIIIFFHHIDIDPKADIGPGFYIIHPNNIILGPIKIGENCSIHHNVTMGMAVANRDKSVPVIGNNVWIGNGVIITGGITIGNGATISSGCVLAKDVPDNGLVIGNPGRVINQEYDNSSFLTFKVKREKR